LAEEAAAGFAAGFVGRDGGGGSIFSLSGSGWVFSRGRGWDGFFSSASADREGAEETAEGMEDCFGGYGDGAGSDDAGDEGVVGTGNFAGGGMVDGGRESAGTAILRLVSGESGGGTGEAFGGSGGMISGARERPISGFSETGETSAEGVGTAAWAGCISGIAERAGGSASAGGGDGVSAVFACGAPAQERTPEITINEKTARI
jgi:hypothetical protein